MANSITGINDDIITQSALQAFVAEIIAIGAFATNISDAAAQKGTTISVPRVSAQDAGLTKTVSAAYTIQDADSDAFELTLGEPQYVSWALSDTEILGSSVLGLEMFGQQKGQALAELILGRFWDDITAANYGAAVFTGVASTFDADDVVDIRTACSAANMPRRMRALIIDENYTGNLLKDGAIQDVSAFGDSRPIREGAIGRLAGFDVFESTLIPGNGENLVGFAVHPSGMYIAMRYHSPQDGHKYSRAEPMTDPETGITIGFREWYDENSGTKRRVLDCINANQVGLSAGIKRLVSA